jgi:transglutaminase-like putative cysteine protease
MSGAVVLGLGTALAGTGRLLSDNAWWFVAMGVAVLVTVTVVALRGIVRWGWVPPLAGLAVLVFTMTLSFAPLTAFAAIVPTGETLGAFRDLVVAGADSIASQSVPAKPTAGIVFMLTAGTALLAISLDWLVVALRQPGLVGIPLFAIVLVPTFVGIGYPSPAAIVLTAVAYLLVLYLDLGERRSGGALGVAAAAVVAALVVPLALPQIAEPQQTSGSGFSAGVNTFINLGENLRQPNVTEVLRYSNERNEPQYLTLAIITRFEGAQWRPGDPQEHEGDIQSIAPVPGLDDGILQVERTTAVTITGMGGQFAPVPYAPRSVMGLYGSWSVNPETYSVETTVGSIRDEQYTVISERPAPTVEQLSASIAGYGPEFDRYLEPPSDFPESLKQLTAEIVGDAESQYEKALALQSFFRDTDFEYSEQTPVTERYDTVRSTAIEQFLERRSGYCVHFASAMAVMARALYIPARLAIGFTPGEFVDAEGEPDYFSVTTANLHAWPELWFDGIGWVRFEPTPGRGFEPSFDSEQVTQPTSGPTTAPTAKPTRSPLPEPQQTEQVDAPSTTAPTRPVDETTPRIIVAVLLVGLALLVLLPFVPLVVRVVRRGWRSTQVARTGSAVHAWAELSDTAVDLGYPIAGLTPRELAFALRQGMPEKAVRALAALLDALEATAFSPAPGRALLRDLRVVRRAMLRAALRRDRVRAVVSPASVALVLRRRR